jgi:uncharacterized protein with HEPN domain
MGEAARALPEKVTGLEPKVDWSRIIAMRNSIGHEYHRIAPETIHATLRNELGPLEVAVHRLKQSLEN